MPGCSVLCGVNVKPPIGKRASRRRQLMTDAFATLNPDLLHLCLSHVAHGRDAARAGATCKHWRAVTSTERLWREICVKRWPSTAKLPRAPASHLAFYKQRIRGPDLSTPYVDLNGLTLLIDGTFGGDRRFSEVLSFRDAIPCEVHPPTMDSSCRGYEWAVPALRPPEDEDIEEFIEDLELDTGCLTVDILSDDGKIGLTGGFTLEDYSNEKYSWSTELYLENRAEQVSRLRAEWFMFYVECTVGKLQVCASQMLREDGDHSYRAWDLRYVLALLDWA